MLQKVKLTKPQKAILETFQSYDFCQILRFADPVSQRLRYALSFQNKGSRVPEYTYPNVRTIDALIEKGILVETDYNSFELSESEADNEH